MKKPIDKTYADVWDTYVSDGFERVKKSAPPADRPLHSWQVLNTSDRDFEWPGDEWGSVDVVEKILHETLYSYVNRPDSQIIELGSGAGRYTEPMLAHYASGQIFAFDVSQNFLDHLTERCAEACRANRLHLELLDGDPSQVTRVMKHREKTIDAMVSYDAMVHVDLHTLVIYWISAAKLLRDGGYVVMSLADCTNTNGLLKLLHDSPGVYRKQGRPGGHFQWMSKDAYAYIFQELGFDVMYSERLNGRDVYIVARLTDRNKHHLLLEKAGRSLF